MLGELNLLIKLQEHDRECDQLIQTAKNFDPEIQSKKDLINSLKDRLKSSKEKATTLQVKKKQLEIDVDSKENQIQKHQSELNSLKSNDAYKAMLLEIKNLKDEIVTIEDEVLVVMESIDQADKEFKETEKQLKNDESQIRTQIQDLENKKNQVLKEVEVKRTERQGYSSTIPANALNQYEAIREQREGIALAPLMNGSCGECHMTVPQNAMNDVKKAKNVVFCESCTRVLYIPQVVVPAETPAP
ncbi:MAG: zinc ribbon domain-containing protein [Elusimicrobiota bacterium]